MPDPQVVTSLRVPWDFSIGDDPAWAEPDFDDSGWQEVRVPLPFAIREVRAESAWYRLTVRVGGEAGLSAAEHADLRLGLWLGKVCCAYEVYAGGQLLGGVGSRPPEPSIDYDRHAIYSVPAAAIEPDGRLVLALRVWKPLDLPGEVAGPDEGPYYLGPIEMLTRREIVSELPQLFLAGLFLLLGAFYFELWRRRLELQGYFWFTVSAVVFAGYTFLRTQWKYMLGDHFLTYKEVEHFFCYVGIAAFIELLWPLLGLRIGKALRTFQWVNVTIGFVLLLSPGLLWNLWMLYVWQAGLLAISVVALWTIFREAWRRHPEARLIAGGATLTVLSGINDVLVDQGLVDAPRLVAFGFGCFIVSLAGSLSNRFLRTHQELDDLRRDLEQRVEERTHELHEASQAKSRFLATMSHEIRTPLNGVIGMSDLLLATGLSPEQSEYAEIVRKSGEALLSLIDDILDFSKIEAGKIELHEAPFRLRQPIEQALDILTPLAVEKDLEMTYEIAPGLATAWVGDVKRLRQVLVNLVGNAVKFTEKGGVRVEVAAAGDDRPGTLCFRVDDTGPGIPADRREDLFQVFSQIDASHARRHGGSGLGLAISRHLCELMSGTIWVEAELGWGSSFQFTIDAKPADADAPEDEEPEPERAAERSRSLRVLLAEDDRVNQMVALRMLKELGYDADVVENGVAALEALGERPYDLVLLDVQMPELDGLETARRIRQRWPEAPLRLVAMTANALKGDREACLEAGMDDYIAKPVKLAGLRSVLERGRE